MFIHQYDIYPLSYFSARNVAKKLGIENTDFKNFSELTEDIRQKDNVAHEKLISFLESYEKWLKFHARIDDDGKAGHLSGNETEELLIFTNQKDLARSELVSYVGLKYS